MDSRLRRLQEAQILTKNSDVPISNRRQRFTAQIITESSIKEEIKIKEELVEEKFVTILDETEEETSSDEELQKMLEKKPILKPIFISKESRNNEKASNKMTFSSSASNENREESRSIVAEILRKEFEAAHVNKTSQVPDALSGAFDPNCVDDTDDPSHFEEEYLSWRLRELLRIKDERNDREKEEIEIIRNMTEEERRKIDKEKMDEWMSKPNSQYKFLQKYYHKGAFYQEEHKEILSRDYAQATGTDRSDRDVLPQILQVKDFGKKGKGKWKHLTAEDTTAFDYGWGAKDNSVNFKSISKMGGMKGDLDNPSKKHKK